MSKHTPTPWVIKKAARASACGIKTVEDIFGANGYRVLVDPMPADRTLIVDSVNALADRDPSKLADLEKEMECAIACLSAIGATRPADNLAAALAAFRKEVQS